MVLHSTYILFLVLTLIDGRRVMERACKLELIGEVQHMTESADLMLGGIMQLSTLPDKIRYMTFTDNDDECSEYSLHFLRHLLVFIFAIEEINRRADILPNITLGYTIYDSCMLEHKAVQSALSILSGREEAVPNYSCDEKSKVVAFIGHLTSSSSLSIAEITGLYAYPQISYGAMDSIFSNRLRFPSFYRTVPDGKAQYEAIVLLLKHFSWSWVGIVRGDDKTSEQAGMELHSLIIQSGICVAFQDVVSDSIDYNFKIVSYKMQKISCDVLIILGNSVGVWRIHETLFKDFNGRKVFIIPSLIIVWKKQYFWSRSLQISLQRRNIPGLKDFLLDMGPYKYPGILTHYVWYHNFCCCIIHSMYASCRPCDETSRLNNVDPSMYDVNNFRYTFSVYSAVYAVASALQDFFLSKCPGHLKSCISNQLFHLGELNRYLKNIHFTTPGGESVYFDHERNSPASFDLMNMFLLNQTEKTRQVGYYQDKNRQFHINNSEIHWDPGFSQVVPYICLMTFHSGSYFVHAFDSRMIMETCDLPDQFDHVVLSTILNPSRSSVGIALFSSSRAVAP